MIDFEQIRIRVNSLQADLDYADDIMKQRAGYETNLWSLKEQKQMECFKEPEFQIALEQQEKMLLQNIQNSEALLLKVREKLLRAMGKM